MIHLVDELLNICKDHVQFFGVEKFDGIEHHDTASALVLLLFIMWHLPCRCNIVPF